MLNHSVTLNKEKNIASGYEEEHKDSESSSNKKKEAKENLWHQFMIKA